MVGLGRVRAGGVRYAVEANLLPTVRTAPVIASFELAWTEMVGRRMSGVETTRWRGVRQSVV